jgi:hypothetical protein
VLLSAERRLKGKLVVNFYVGVLSGIGAGDRLTAMVLEIILEAYRDGQAGNQTSADEE